MTQNKLLIIDPQNDFLPLPNSTLPVAGALEDMDRLVSLIALKGHLFNEIAVTLDSHGYYGVERPSFWVDSHTGRLPTPFTSISLEDVEGGRFRPANPAELPRVVRMLTELQKSKPGPLMVWPVHCVVGTRGHNVYAPLALALAEWQRKHALPVKYVFKGMNPFTEHFSAIKADVVLPEDPHTDWNRDLLSWIQGNEQTTLWVAGEASSHCVRYTVEDILAWNAQTGLPCPSLAILQDCMSPVSGFKYAETEFFENVKKAGGSLVVSTTLWGELNG